MGCRWALLLLVPRIFFFVSEGLKKKRGGGMVGGMLQLGGPNCVGGSEASLLVMRS